MPTVVPDRDELLRAAHWYAARGWHVFPVVPNAKTPAVKDWEHAATTDPGQLAAMWRRGAFNIGIACGPSGLVVVDLDVPKEPGDQPPADLRAVGGVLDGADVLAVLAEQAGQPFPYATHTVTTASGGLHLYFTQPAACLPLRNTSGKVGWKIDTRGHGGYVVAAGSVVDGHRYRTLSAAQPVPVPAWLTDLLTTAPDRTGGTGRRTGTGGRVGPSAYALAALRAELDRVLTAAPNTRNDTLNVAAFALGQLVAGGALDRSQVETALTVAAHHIGLGPTETARTIASGLASGHTQPRSAAG